MTREVELETSSDVRLVLQLAADVGPGGRVDERLVVTRGWGPARRRPHELVSLG